MRISMGILADWLKEYDPVVEIESGDRVLRNARILSDGLKPSRSTVYLNTLDSDTVLCSNNNDMILLHCADIHQALNCILDAFEYYNEWGSVLHEMVQQGCSAKELLEAASPMLCGVLIFADATFFVHEICGSFAEFSDEKVFRESLENRILPLRSLLHLNRDQIIRKPLKKAYFVDIPDLREHPLVTNLFSGGVHQGWLIVCHADNNFSQAEMDLQEAFSEILNSWLERNDSQHDRFARSGLLLDILSDRIENKKAALRRLEAFQWRPRDPKLVYVIRSRSEGNDPAYAIDHYLEHISHHGFVLHYHDDLLFLVNLSLTDLSVVEYSMQGILSACGCRAGKSPVFEDIFSLSSYYKSASIAADHPSHEVFIEYERIKLDYALKTLREDVVLDVLHPAVSLLECYDKKHSTVFCETLFVFLQTACNYADTAKQLFIHRSTLLYRIDKIQKLTGIDLKDPETRFHLELSYRLKQ